MKLFSRSIIVAICSTALLISGCASKTFIVRESDLFRVDEGLEVIGAVDGRCHQTAIRVDRIAHDEWVPTGYSGYVYVKEKTSRTMSLGVGLGSMLVGIGLTSFGALMLKQSADSPDHDRLIFGAATPTLGVVSVAGGGALTGFGIATAARGGRRGAEVPRRWSPDMTAEAPCVDDQRGDALTRARSRNLSDHNSNATPNLPVYFPLEFGVIPEPPIEAQPRQEDFVPAPDVP